MSSYAIEKKLTLNAIMITILVAMSSPTVAETRDGWSIQLEPMYMSLYGYDDDILSVFRIDDGPPTNLTVEQNDIDLEGDFGIRGEVQWLRGQWGVGVNGFYFGTDGNNSGSVDQGSSDEISMPFVFTDGPNGRVTFAAKKDVDMWAFDLYGIRTLAEKKDSNLNLLFGLKVANLETSLNSRAAAGTVAGGVFTAEETSALDAQSDSGTMYGPLIGITGDAKFGRHRIKGLLMQSVVFGDSDLKAKIDLPDNLSFMTNQSNDVSIPVTEVSIKYLYNVWDNLFLGVGVYASVWFDAPVASITAIPGGAGITATGNEETLSTIGGMLTAEFQF